MLFKNLISIRRYSSELQKLTENVQKLERKLNYLEQEIKDKEHITMGVWSFVGCSMIGYYLYKK